MQERLVVVGYGMAAQRLLEELVRLAPGRHAITVVGAEPRPAYNRILLSPVLAGEKSAADLELAEPGWCAHHGIRVRLGAGVTALDPAERTVALSDGGVLPYDRLVLAMGSDAVRLPVPGARLPGVLTFRDLDDVDAMLARARPGAPAVVIGGGLLGLEAASGLRRRGMAVTVVHRFDTLMERQLDRGASDTLRRTLEAQGLAFRMGVSVRAVLGTEAAEAVEIADGAGQVTALPAGLVVMAVGIRPRVEPARAAGLACGAGVQVDDRLRTSDAAIQAIGECAEHRGRAYGLVAPLYEQALVCARQLAGDAGAAYGGSLEAATLKVSGVAVASLGAPSEDTAGEPILFRDPAMGIYRKLVVSGGRLAGAVLVGDTRDAAWFAALIREGRDIATLREDMIFGQEVTEARLALAAPAGVLSAPPGTLAAPPGALAASAATSAASAVAPALASPGAAR